MNKIYNTEVILISLYFLSSCVILVACTNGSLHRSPGAVQLVKSGHKKDNVTEEKARNRNHPNKNKKGVNVSKDPVQAKSPIKKKLNTAKEGTRTTKGNLRMVNNGNWPKLQKRRQRDKESSTDSPRVTKMNMMQMDEQNTLATLPTLHKFGLEENDNINEVLSPYSIKQQMMRIGARFKDVNVSVEVIGRTLEYNDIVLLKLTDMSPQGARFRADDKKYVDDTNEKKIMFIVHGLSVMGMISLDCLVEEKKFIQLVSYYFEHLDKFDILLMPMANPDGYGYKAKTAERISKNIGSQLQLWNKNLSPQDACPGVALDRNFDVGWNSTRTISSCSQQYPGPAPFSEPESRAVRDVLHRYSHKIMAYIHVHAGTYSPDVFKGDAVLYPRGYTDIQSDDDKYIDLKGEIDETMRKASFQVYSVAVEPLFNWYGRVSGSSVDYAATVYGIPYAMEFVMQLYEDEEWRQTPSAERTGTHVLVEVWKRVIDVVANNIWNSLKSNEV